MSAKTNVIATSFSMSRAARLFAVLVTVASAPLAANAGQQADYFRNSGYRNQETAGSTNGTQEESKSADASSKQEENGDSTAADTEPKTVEEQLEATQKEVKDLKTELEEFLEAEEKAKKEKEEKPKSWFEKYRLNGYTQIRFNEDVDVDPGSARPQHVGDASVGDDRSFLIRRARLIISGDVTDRISIYLQPDFAITPPGSPDANQFVQVRDWYADLHFDDEKVYRIRVGQSKIPYGWENLQSSRNRLPLDRNDALNSAVRNERDLGAFFYYTPEYAQEFFKYTVDEGFKRSGNYGIFGLGLYNGQGGSFLEQNDNLHLVTRLTVPFNYNDCQMMEAGIQG
jgi:Phosphate-selective porin O and P